MRAAQMEVVPGKPELSFRADLHRPQTEVQIDIVTALYTDRRPLHCNLLPARQREAFRVAPLDLALQVRRAVQEERHRACVPPPLNLSLLQSGGEYRHEAVNLKFSEIEGGELAPSLAGLVVHSHRRRPSISRIQDSLVQVKAFFCITVGLVRASQCLAGASPRAALDRAAHGYGLPVKGSARIPRADRSPRFSVSASAVPDPPASAPSGQ